MEHQWKPDKALGAGIASLDREALCKLVIALCRAISDETQGHAYRGGVYPENISRDEDGSLGIGPGKRGGWDDKELQFVAPELYWNGECSPESDVYSLGLLLWYGLSGGKLPMEGKSPFAQLSRMNGAEFKAPAGCGPRLKEIVETATRFRREERYETPRALALVLESCLENKYFDAEEGAALFKKEEGELNEAERMLLDILDPGRAAAETPQEPAGEAEKVPLPPPRAFSPEEAARLILMGNSPESAPAPKREEPVSKLVEEFFGKPEPKPEPETEPKTEPKPEPEPETETEPEPEPKPEPEPDDVRVYEPGRDRRDSIPVLTVEENPELLPVVPKRRQPRYSEDEERSREIAAEVRKRRTRPVGVVLVLCGLLIIAALVANHFLQSYEWEDEGRGRQISMPEVGGDAISSDSEFISVEELEREEQEQQAAARQSYYQIFPGDISWTSAKNEAGERGGMLAVINSADELTMITQLAQQSGMQGVWIGCHREGSFLVWETQEPTAMMSWADGEPSYLDSRDGAAEDFVMLWNTGSGWAFIDCRNDPVAADPNIYSGRIGYVCEFTN